MYVDGIFHFYLFFYLFGFNFLFWFHPNNVSVLVDMELLQVVRGQLHPHYEVTWQHFIFLKESKS